MFKLKFKGKVLLSILTPIILIVGIIQYVAYTISADIVINEAEVNLTEKSTGAVKLIEQQIEADQTLLKIIAENPATIKALAENDAANTEAMQQSITTVLTQNSQIESILLIDRSGKVIVSDNAESAGTDLSKENYVSDSLQGKTSISPAQYSKKTGKLVFILAVPVKIADKTAGVLAAVNTMDYFSENIIKPIKMGKTGYALITDVDGVFLVHPKDSLIMNRDYFKKPDSLNLANMGEGIIHYYWAVDDLDKIMQITRVSNGWLVAVTVPKNELLSVLDPLKYVSLAGGIALIIIICLVVFLVIGSVARVLTALKDNINNLAQGITAKIDSQQNLMLKALKRKDEFAEITEATNHIQKYLEDMSAVALAVSQKDLTVKPEIRCKDDVLGNAMNTLIDEFSFAFHRVTQTVSQVNKGAQQVSSASLSLSQGATEQAASIEEITASVAELGSQTANNAGNAASANELSISANKSAETGHRQMEELSCAMDSISQRAEETQKVIKSIDDIAFQTNLLALNAAVEAARAGIHGKGFAVVAEEVRNLAARSAKAAGETAELIANVVNEVNSGNSITRVTAESLSEIVAVIKKSTALIGEIAIASNEQAEGVSQINLGLQQIEKVTQSNTANAEETASSSEEMSSMSNILNQLVSEFKLNDPERKKPHYPERKKPAQPKRQNFSRQEVKADIISPERQIKLDDTEFGKF